MTYEIPEFRPCGGCGGERLPGPGRAYLHKPHCVSQAQGIPVLLVSGCSAWPLGTLQHGPGMSQEYALALMMRAASTAWLAKLESTIEMAEPPPMPGDVTDLAGQLLTAETAQEAAWLGAKLAVSIGDWLGGPGG